MNCKTCEKGIFCQNDLCKSEHCEFCIEFKKMDSELRKYALENCDVEVTRIYMERGIS